VPGIIRWPGKMNAGTVRDDLIVGTDYLPTICDLAGAALPEGRTIDGTSLTPLIKNKPIYRTIPPCWHFRPVGTFPFMAMRDGDYVMLAWPDLPYKEDLGTEYMHWLKHTSLTNFELYNLREDIGQKIDLAQSEPELMKQMNDKILSLWHDIQAEGPLWENLRTRYDSDGSGQNEKGF